MNIASWPLSLSRRWGRTLVRLGAGLFTLSTAFPVLASLVPAGRLPGWVGYLDVVLAGLLVLIMILILAAAGNNIPSRVKQFCYEVYRGAASLPLLLLVVFFVLGDRIQWTVLLPGLAWRAWLVLYSLPAALTVWEAGKSSGRRDPVELFRLA